MILVTGGCGFIGSNFIRHVLQARKEIKVVNLDLLTYAGNLSSLLDVEKEFPDRYQFVRGDIRDKEFLRGVFETFELDSVAHFAAESHVDRSILGPEVFVQTNVYGTFNLLEICRKSWSDRGMYGTKAVPSCFHRRGLRFPGEIGLFHGRIPLSPFEPVCCQQSLL